MARNKTDIISFIHTIHAEHRDYWQQKSAELKRYKNAYSSKFWQEQDHNSTMIRIETSDAHNHIEGYIASLFSKSPAVVISPDIAATGGNAQLAQAAANRFLYNQRQQLEIASRLALIYDYAALKLCPQESDEMLDKVVIEAIPCWEVIVDRDSSSREGQRFVGHNYFMNLVEAKRKFGGKAFKPVPKKDYFETATMNKENKTLPDDYLYVEIVEIYDLVNDEVYYWSPNLTTNDGLLEREAIPLRTYDDRGLPNISLLYFSRVPSRPMEGMSALSRIYDQIYEKNILRTYWANSVRRDSRQYLYKEGMFDEDQLAKITAGIDGAMIGVDSETLDGLIQTVGVDPISSNFDRYLNYIEQDLSKGSAMAPFTRGQASKATATEITALAQYTTSEIGKLAREKDEALEGIINIYLRLLDLLAEDGDTAVLTVDGEAKVITPKDFDGKFRINALDQGSTPLSDAIKKQDFINLIPTLQNLGVPPASLLSELTRLYDLPKDFVASAEEAAEQAAQAAAAQAQQAPANPLEQLGQAPQPSIKDLLGE
jgi:ribosomal protein S17E